MEDERDNSLLYALILVFFSFVTYAVLIMAQALALQPQIQNLKRTITNRQTQITGYQAIKTDYGKLFIKSLTLQPLLDKDLNPAEIFSIADAVNKFDPQMGIVSYSREASGVFVFDILSPSVDKAAGLMGSLSQLSVVKDVFIRSIDVGAESKVVKIVTEVTINAS